MTTTMTANPMIEKKIWTQIDEWSKRIASMPMSPEDEIEWRKSWFVALTDMFEMGAESTKYGMNEKQYKRVLAKGASDMKKRILEEIEKFAGTLVHAENPQDCFEKMCNLIKSIQSQ